MSLIDGLLISLGVIFVLNAYVTWKLYFRGYYGLEQKRYQTLMIWLLPVVVAIIVLHFMSSDVRVTENKHDENYDSLGLRYSGYRASDHDASGGGGE